MKRKRGRNSGRSFGDNYREEEVERQGRRTRRRGWRGNWDRGMEVERKGMRREGGGGRKRRRRRKTKNDEKWKSYPEGQGTLNLIKQKKNTRESRLGEIMKFIEKYRCDLFTNGLAKEIIENDYMICFEHINQRRVGFDWSTKRNILLELSILNGRLNMVLFLLDKQCVISSVVSESERFVNLALKQKCYDILLVLEKTLGVKLNVSLLPLRELVLRSEKQELLIRFYNGQISFNGCSINELIGISIENKEWDILDILLKSYNGRVISTMPLLAAIAFNHTQVSLKLIGTNKIDCSILSNKAIKTACENGMVEVVRMLLQRSEVNPGDDHNIAMVNACRNGFVEIVQMLINSEFVDPSDMENYALDEARKFKHSNVERILLTDGRVRIRDLKTLPPFVE